MFHLSGVGFVGRGKKIGAGVGLLWIYIDQDRLIAKSETFSSGVAADFLINFSSGFSRGFHAGTILQTG